MSLSRFRYIVVEGAVGSGKSRLARLLANHLEAELLRESPENNPFLARFYQDMPRYALATQLTFLFQRLHQVDSLNQEDLFRGHTVADFLLDKDALFAEITLTPDELRLYQEIYNTVRITAPVPDLVIYLQSGQSRQSHLTEEKGRQIELPIPDGYLQRLSARYSRYFYDYNASPLLIVNAENLNFVEGGEDFALLLARIENMHGSREFFNKA